MSSPHIIIIAHNEISSSDLCNQLIQLGYKAVDIPFTEDDWANFPEFDPDRLSTDLSRTGALLRAAAREIQRQTERVEILLQIATQTNPEIELDTALHNICDAAARILKSNGTSIQLRDNGRNVLRSAAIAGDTPFVTEYNNASTDVSFEVLQSLAGSSFSTETLLRAADYPNPQFAALFQKFNIQTIVMVPLYRHDDLFGYFSVFFSTAKSELLADERNLIKGLAAQAGIAISNVSSFEQVRTSRERQQLLTRKLVEVQENERQSLARELHDEIGQMLTGLQFTIKWLMANANQEQKNRLEQVQIIISAIISQIRELSINLRPSLLDDLGILPTLEWYLERYEATTGVQVHFDHQDINQRFSPELETAAFRIVQEALTNAARYAETETISITIQILKSVMQIEIVDAGKGFDLAGLSGKKSVGIEGMRERAYAIGGIFDIDSQLGVGTRIRASLPISGRVERRSYDRDHSSRR